MRGRVTGPDVPGSARVLPPEQNEEPRSLIKRKYWLARLPVWSRDNVYLEIAPDTAAPQ